MPGDDGPPGLPGLPGEMGARGFENAQRFLWPNIAKRFEDSYRQICESARNE